MKECPQGLKPSYLEHQMSELKSLCEDSKLVSLTGES
jgi:hypothetical protein